MVNFFGKYTGFVDSFAVYFIRSLLAGISTTVSINHKQAKRLNNSTSEAIQQLNNKKLLLLSDLPLWYRIMSMSRPGMAAPDPFDPQPNAFEYAPFVDGFDGVLRAGWCIATVVAEMRRDRRLVKTNG